MAVSNQVSVDDLTDVVCKCSLCKQLYKDPRMLPCLHQYCRDCLVGLIDSKEREKKICCPECRQKFLLPKDGVEEFKSDFQMKYITEHLRLVTSLLDGHTSECCVCARISKVSAYCYKCDDYLCIDCYNDHPSRRCFKDHKSHVFSSKDLTSKNTTYEKLASLKKDPQCKTHPQNVAQLCCISCSKLPICVVCVHGEHKDHNTGDVIDLAKLDTERLRKELASLPKYKEKANEMKETVKMVKQEVEKSFSERKKSSQSYYEKELNEIESKITAIAGKVQLSKMELNNVHNEHMAKLQQTMEAELQALNDKYDQLFEKEERDYKAELSTLDGKHREEASRLNGKRTLVDKAFRDWATSTENEQVQALSEIDNISHHFDGTLTRLENLTATATRVVASKHEWTMMKCIPVIREAIQPLVGDATKKFPKLQSLLQPTTSPSFSMILSRRSRPLISEHEETVIDLEEIRKQGFYISDMTNTMKDEVIIGGDARQKQSHITVVDLSGKIQKQIEFDSSLYNPRRFCTFLSDHRIATVGEHGEISIVDLRGDAKLSKTISDVIPDWSDQHVVSCVCADSIRSQIFVGCEDSKDIQVFNSRLERVNTVILPDPIGWPRCIAFSEDTLLVCDFDGKRACAVTMKGKLLFKFQLPSNERCDRPHSLCTDENGFIYVLWVDAGNFFGEYSAVVVQYSQGNCHKLSERIVNGEARCIATVKQDQSEKLLLATWKSANIYVYKLIHNEE